jgi:hypothetical protein
LIQGTIQDNNISVYMATVKGRRGIHDEELDEEKAALAVHPGNRTL